MEFVFDDKYVPSMRYIILIAIKKVKLTRNACTG